MNHIEKIWREFEQRCVPAAAAQVQRREMRRSFYAGASALFSLVMRELSPGPDCEPADERLMDDLSREMRQFEQDVRQNRA
jgi:hypothetical protein